MLAFLTVVSHPAHTQSYKREWQLVADTVGSALAQSDDAIEAVVVCNRALGPIADPRAQVVEVDWPPVGHASARDHLSSSETVDRAAKRAVGIASLQQSGIDHVMFCDAGDFVANDVAEFVNQRPDVSGWYIDRGYATTPETFTRVDGFSGWRTAHIVRFDLLAGSIPAELDPSWPVELVTTVVAEGIGTDVLGNQDQFRPWLQALGFPLEALPARAVVWDLPTEADPPNPAVPSEATANRHLDELTLGRPPSARFTIPDHRVPKVVLAAEGVAHLRASRSDEARAHWSRYWERAVDDEVFADAPVPKIGAKRVVNDRFTVVAPRTEPPDKGGRSVCVYTSLFGEYDTLRSPLCSPSGVDFICFSDRTHSTPGWQLRVVDPGMDHPALQSRRVKILAHEYLAEYDFSLYVDANTLLVGHLSLLLDRWLGNEPFVAWPHPERADVYEECEAILAQLKHSPDPIVTQYAMFLQEQVPRETGMIEASFLWRNHHDPDVRKLMDLWWTHLESFGARDQPGLAYWMWKTDIRPQLLPTHLGTARSNDFAVRLGHDRTMIDVERSRSAPTGSGSAPRRKAFGAGRAVQKISWVYRSGFEEVATTIMRGQQLSEIAKQHLGETTPVCLIDESQMEELTESIVILTKGFLKRTSPEELDPLKKAGNIICADFVDAPIRSDLDEFIDVFVASSLRQLSALSKTRPNHEVHLISHHADPRLEGIRGPTDRCRIGYFGEISHARYQTKLRGAVDFCQIDTKGAGTDWIRRLGDVNVHYAVRSDRKKKGFKPFIKGFTAAHCHANIIVPIHESDARYYLGSDYPYMLQDDSWQSVTATIEALRESFGGPQWDFGLEIMASVRERTSPARIGAEIENLLALLS